ncbi:MAG: hypothetical protein LBB41_07705, partial [Prevotellaceae bacterium]|nr:hypothetical protein [Prevotellaceae bacterium]
MNFLEQSLDKQNQWWKYLVVILVAFVAANTVGAIPMAVVIVYQILQTGDFDISSLTSNSMDFSNLGISHNVSLFVLLFTFAIMLLALILMIKALHGRSVA